MATCWAAAPHQGCAEPSTHALTCSISSARDTAALRVSVTLCSGEKGTLNWLCYSAGPGGHGRWDAGSVFVTTAIQTLSQQ